MNNEDKILSMLSNLTEKVASIEQGQDELRKGQDELRKGQDELRKDVSIIKKDVADLKANLDYVWEDIKMIDERLSVNETKIKHIAR